MAASNPDPKSAATGRWVLTVLALFTLFIVGSTLYVIYDNKHSIPYGDHWSTIKLFDAYLHGNLNFNAFWEQHQEHRIPIPSILILLDYVLAHGTGYLLISLTLLIQAVQALLLGGSIWKNKSLKENDRLFFAFVAVIACFWLVQSGNLIWGFQIAWFLNGLAASMAAFLICGIDPESEFSSIYITVAGAALCCLIAAYSLANGLFMCVPLLAVIWKLKQSRTLMIFWIFFGLALGGSFLAGYQSPGPSYLREVLHPGTWHYLLAYLGNPVSRFHLLAGTLLGVVGLTMFFFFAGRFIAAQTPSFFMAFGFAQTTYVVLTALITAIGRNGHGVSQATSSRYYTTVLLFWFFLVVLAYESLPSGGRAARWMRVGVMLLLLGFVLPVQLGAIPQRRIRYIKNDEVSLALIAGVQDTSALHFTKYPPEDSVIWEQNDFLRRHRLSVYRQPWALVMGRDLSEAYRQDSNAALKGEVEEMRPVEFPLRSGYFVSGRVDLTGGSKRPEVILFVNEGRIVGLAKTAKRPCQGCFSGYVKGLENRRFDLFGLEDYESKSVRKIPVSWQL